MNDNETWSEKTIARTATKKIAEIKKSHPRCYVYSLSNDFIGREVPPDYAWTRHAEGRAKLTVDSRGKVRITVHSNEWYELLPRD